MSKDYVVKEISAGSCITVEIEGVWYKMEYREVRELLSGADEEKERKDLFETVNNTVDDQYEELFKKD